MVEFKKKIKERKEHMILDTIICLDLKSDIYINPKQFLYLFSTRGHPAIFNGRHLISILIGGWNEIVAAPKEAICERFDFLYAFDFNKISIFAPLILIAMDFDFLHLWF